MEENGKAEDTGKNGRRDPEQMQGNGERKNGDRGYVREEEISQHNESGRVQTHHKDEVAHEQIAMQLR